MKIGIPAALLAVAAVLFLFGAAIGEEEPIALALAAAAASVLSYVVVLRGRVASAESASVSELRLSAIEARLSLTEGELDAANLQIQRLRMERDFDRDLEAGRAGVGARTLARPE
jgi:hypothetical protein